MHRSLRCQHYYYYYCLHPLSNSKIQQPLQVYRLLLVQPPMEFRLRGRFLLVGDKLLLIRRGSHALSLHVQKKQKQISGVGFKRWNVMWFSRKFLQARLVVHLLFSAPSVAFANSSLDSGMLPSEFGSAAALVHIFLCNARYTSMGVIFFFFCKTQCTITKKTKK